MTIKRVKRTGRHVEVKDDHTLVITLGGEPYVELRPYYNEGIGAVIEVYKVLMIEPVYLFTLHLNTIGPLVQKLPIAVAAARRLARQAGRSGVVEPNAKSGSSPT